MSEPFLKWAGGKRWLVHGNLLPTPANYERYVEPFLGGGAVFFHLEPAQAGLSDLNRDLIELYTVIRDDPEQLFAAMFVHHELHCHEHYYFVRANVPTNSVDRAARTLYLNRTCWNGLYRVNLQGAFNVPIGSKNTVLFEGETFVQCADALRRATLNCQDFEQTIDGTGHGDFLFVDPPYSVQHNQNGFVKYNEHIFSWADQIRLREAIGRAVLRGVAVVMTNADHKSIHDLYGNICSYQQLQRNSVLAGGTAHRGPTTEAMFVANLD